MGKTYSSAYTVRTLVLGAPSICYELLGDNCPINMKLHHCVTHDAVIGSAVLFIFEWSSSWTLHEGAVVCISLSLTNRILWLKGRRRLLLCHIPPAPNTVAILLLPELTYLEPGPPLIAFSQVGGQGGPTKGPTGSRINMGGGQVTSGSRKVREGGRAVLTLLAGKA